MEFQLPRNEVTIPDLLNMRPSAVFVLIHFNCGCYHFPPEDKFTVLISHVIAADLLGFYQLLEFVWKKLCIPIARFDTSNPYEVVKKLVRDCYHLDDIRYEVLSHGALYCLQFIICLKCSYCHELWVV